MVRTAEPIRPCSAGERSELYGQRARPLAARPSAQTLTWFFQRFSNVRLAALDEPQFRLLPKRCLVPSVPSLHHLGCAAAPSEPRQRENTEQEHQGQRIQ